MWYRALLSGEQLAAGCVAAIRSQFAIAVQSAGEPTGACLFITSREIPDVTEPSNALPPGAEDAVYFSPASVAAVRQLIAHYNAQPSPPPTRGRAVLLVGGPSDWDLLPRSTH
jgi:hypothetical protein